jgi:hypothetical protein
MNQVPRWLVWPVGGEDATRCLAAPKRAGPGHGVGHHWPVARLPCEEITDLSRDDLPRTLIDT